MTETHDQETPAAESLEQQASEQTEKQAPVPEQAQAKAGDQAPAAEQAETPEEKEEKRRKLEREERRKAHEARKQRKQEVQKIANRYANELKEKENIPRRQIFNIIDKAGEEFAAQLLEKTKEIEANGGMLIDSGERRRTIGGVFFYLARQELPPEIRDRIFKRWRSPNKERATLEEKFPKFNWENRHNTIERLLENKGEISEVRVILTGRPGKIERRHYLVITTMVDEQPVPETKPMGLPDIPPGPHNYIVYIAAKQWERVSKVLDKDPEDELYIDGMCVYDPEVEGMAIYSMFVSTRKLFKQERKEHDQKTRDGMKASQERRAAKEKAAKEKSEDDGKKAPKKAKGSKPKAQREGTKAAAPQPTPAVPEVEVNIPEGMPPRVAKKLTDLYTAAATFRQKIATLESKPESEQTGLEMTRRVLKNTERQIETLEKQYKND